MNKENNNLPATLLERLFNGIIKENPTFVLLLGMCPTLAVTTSAMNGLGMGLSTMVVLALSNMLISALRKIIPDKVRIPAFIVIIASFVTMVELLLKAYIPVLYDNLGLYIPLIVVNCIILGRAEAYAYSNPVLPSLFDGLGMGLGFSFALTIIGGVREIVGSGEIFGYHFMPAAYVPVSIFVMAPGAFFVLAILTAIQNAIKIAGEKKGKDMSKIQSGCGGNCLDCDKDCKKPEFKNKEAKAAAVKKDDTAKSEEKTKEEKVLKDKSKEDKTKVSKDTTKISKTKSDKTEASEVKTEETKATVVKPKEVKASEVESKEDNADELMVEEINLEVENEKTDKNKASDVIETKTKTSKAKETKTKETKVKETKATETKIKVKDSKEESKEKVNKAKAKVEKEITEESKEDKKEVKTKKSTTKVDKEVTVVEEKVEFKPDSELDPEVAELLKQMESENPVVPSDDSEIILIESDDEVFELIDIEDYKKALSDNKKKTNKPVNKPTRKKSGVNKAKEMLSKAEETVKGEDE